MRPSRTTEHQPSIRAPSDCGGDVGHLLLTVVGAVVPSYHHAALTFTAESEPSHHSIKTVVRVEPGTRGPWLD